MFLHGIAAMAQEDAVKLFRALHKAERIVECRRRAAEMIAVVENEPLSST